MARVIGKPDASGFTGAVGTGDFSPACILSLSTSANNPNSGNTVLPGRINSGNLAPQTATWAYTTGAQIYTLTRSFTSDQNGVVIRKYGVETSGGVLVFENNFPNQAELFSGDQIAVTIPVDLGL
jgi:hypothetical protein